MAESMGSDFELVKKLGTGTFGDVYQVVYAKDKLTYALKVIDVVDKSCDVSKVLQEIQLLKEVEHPNIVKFHKGFRLNSEDKKISKLGILTELCDSGDMDNFIMNRNGKRFSSQTMQKWMMELTSAVGFLHARSIMHRDLKPGNVFLDKYMNVKIGDFGIAKSVLHGYAGTQIGTTIFMAPETHTGCYYLEADIYSLGCVFLCMATVEPLPKTSVGRFHLLPVKIQYGRAKNTIIRACLQTERTKRPTASDIYKVLSTDDYSTLCFSHVRNENVSITQNPFIVWREDVTKNGGHLFSNRPLKPNEKFCLLIQKVAEDKPSNFEFGFTATNPTVSPEPVHHDVLSMSSSFTFKVGSKMAFWFTNKGSLVYEYHEQTTTSERTSELSTPLWAFFKLNGELLRVKLTDYD